MPYTQPQQQQPSPMSQPQHSKQFQHFKTFFQASLPCKSNDMSCWYSLLPTLPCQIDNTSCWKEQYPQIPCEQKNYQCWRKLIPTLPCKVNDKLCWKDIKNHQPEKILNRKNQEIQLNHIYREEGFHPMRYMERQFGGNKDVKKDGDMWVV